MAVSWLTQAAWIVAATGLLSSVGSVAIFATGELLRKKHSGCLLRVLGASFTGASGLVGGIVAACVLVEFLKSYPFLTVGISTAIALSVDLGFRAGWRAMLRVLLEMGVTGLKALRDKDGPAAKPDET